MEEFTSLSTGCFVVKPPKKRSGCDAFPQSYKEESKESLANKYSVFIKRKEYFDIQVKTILQKINKETVNNIISFISQGQQEKCIGIHTLTIKVGINFKEFSPIYDHSSSILLDKLNLKSVILNDLQVQASDATNVLKDIFSQILDVKNATNDALLKTLSMKGLFSQIVAENKCSGLVIFIPRFDVLPSGTMDKLVSICISASTEFQIFFVLGLATGSELSPDWMSSSTLSQLNVETLALTSPTLLLEKALSQTLLDVTTPFKLSYRTFEVLLSRFSFSSYSLQDVIKTVQVALLNHCFHQPLFRLIEYQDKKLVLDLNDLTNEDKALILQLPSVQKYIERIVISNKSLALNILTGNTDAIQLLFGECIENYSILYVSFRVLHVLIKNIPGNNLVSKPLELYSFCIQGNVNQIKEVCVALKCFGMIEAKSFIERLEDANSQFEDSDHVPQKIQLFKKVVEDQITEMKCVMNELNPTCDEVRSSKDKLKKLQMSFISRLENFFSTLAAPTTWPMHEIIWYTNHLELQNILVGKCRTAIHRGLTNPNLYLQATEKTSKPHLCHLYELYHEQGRLISLHDWIQSFHVILDKKKISNEIHAKFIRSVSELQFMGYLKPTKRKTDHVAKLSLLGY